MENLGVMVAAVGALLYTRKIGSHYVDERSRYYESLALMTKELEERLAITEDRFTENNLKRSISYLNHIAQQPPHPSRIFGIFSVIEQRSSQ